MFKKKRKEKNYKNEKIKKKKYDILLEIRVNKIIVVIIFVINRIGNINYVCNINYVSYL